MAKRLTARLSAGAALVTGLGMMGLATAVPAQADITKELAFSCAVSDLGIQFEDPWTVNLNVGLDDQYDTGAEIAAPTITAAVTPGADANERMRSLNIKSLEGTASTKYSFGDTERTAELTIPKVDVPATGSVTTTASGTGTAETAPAEDTTVDITAGNFTAALTTDTGFVLNLACTAPAANTVGTVTIGDAPTEPEPTVNDWFDEPSGLPLVDNVFTVKGEAKQDGKITVVVLAGTKDADGEAIPGDVLKTYEMNATKGANSADFKLVENADYVRLVSQDCVDADGNDGTVAGGCNVTYRAPWAEDGNNDDGGTGTDDGDDTGTGTDDGDDAGTGTDDGDGSTPVIPDVVQTDGFQRVPANGDDNTASFLLGGALLAGAGASVVVVARRRKAAQI